MKRLLVMAGVTGLIFGVYAWLSHSKQVAGQQEAADKQLVDLDKDGITGIELWRRERDPNRIQFANVDGSWQLVHPVTYPAASASVEGLMNQVLDKAWESSFESTELGKFDLAEEGRFRIRWTTAEGSETIWIGKDTPFGGNLYARTSRLPGQVLVVNSNFKFQMERALKDWRDKDVFFSFPESISSIESVTESASWMMVRQGDNWTIDGQVLDSDKVDPYTDRIRNMMARDFLADGASVDDRVRNGVEPPARSIRVVGADGQVRELLFAAPGKPGAEIPVLVPDRNQILSISRYVYDSLWKTPAELAPDPPPAETATTDIEGGPMSEPMPETE